MTTPLRQRMLEELQRRNYSTKTIRLYLRHVAEFAKHFHRSPDQLGAEDIRQPQLFLIQEKKLAWSSYNQIVCALRFFYAKTLQRAFLLQEIPFPRMEQRLPTILSREEVARILTVPPHLKTRALLMTIYAAGLRRSEAAHLRVNDIDSARMTITVRQGKGQKDRLVMLSPVLLETLRQSGDTTNPSNGSFPEKILTSPSVTTTSSRFFTMPSVALESPRRSRRIRCATALQPICSSRAPICVPSRSCWGIAA